MSYDRIRALGPWLAEGKYVWITLASSAVAILFALRPCSTEPLIRLTGLALQVLGVATVAWGIAETRALFGHTPIFSLAKSWFGRFPLRRRSIVVAVAGASSATATGQARGYVTHGPGPNPTIETRLEALEKNIEAVQGRITSTQRAIDEQGHKSSEELAAEVNSRQAEDARTRGMLESTATGGVHISAMGATWLFVGVVLSTAAPELAEWLK
jgi:hypothetical protein